MSEPVIGHCAFGPKEDIVVGKITPISMSRVMAENESLKAENARMKKELQEAAEIISQFTSTPQVVLCPWCNPEVTADRYFLCEKHKAEVTKLSDLMRAEEAAFKYAETFSEVQRENAEARKAKTE